MVEGTDCTYFVSIIKANTLQLRVEEGLVAHGALTRLWVVWVVEVAEGADCTYLVSINKGDTLEPCVEEGLVAHGALTRPWVVWGWCGLRVQTVLTL